MFLNPNYGRYTLQNSETQETLAYVPVYLMFCQHKPGIKVEKLTFINIWCSASLSDSQFRSLLSLEILNREFPFPDLFKSSLQKSPAVLKIWGQQQLLRHLIASEQTEKSYWTRKKLLKESHCSHYKNINSSHGSDHTRSTSNNAVPQK